MTGFHTGALATFFGAPLAVGVGAVIVMLNALRPDSEGVRRREGSGISIRRTRRGSVKTIGGLRRVAGRYARQPSRLPHQRFSLSETSAS